MIKPQRRFGSSSDRSEDPRALRAAAGCFALELGFCWIVPGPLLGRAARCAVAGADGRDTGPDFCAGTGIGALGCRICGGGVCCGAGALGAGCGAIET